MKKAGRRRPWWLLETETDQFTRPGHFRHRWGGWPQGWRYPLQTKEWTPAIDMFDRGDALVLLVELPGVPQENIDITLEQDVLTIRGERKVVENAHRAEWLCCERPSGKFYRAVELPAAIDGDQITAEYKDGILTVTLPKISDTQAKKVSVKVR